MADAGAVDSEGQRRFWGDDAKGDCDTVCVGVAVENGCILFARTQTGVVGGYAAGASALGTAGAMGSTGDGEGMEEVSMNGYAAITLADGDGR